MALAVLTLAEAGGTVIGKIGTKGTRAEPFAPDPPGELILQWVGRSSRRPDETAFGAGR
ncbi:MAG TPA: hypothetical protein VK284_15085 [Streptosporangiaceae bacterium]|nr:hypothetical protein [Streptosporangiaceae bacterium]